MKSTRPTWAEVSRSRLTQNHDALRRLAGHETELLCVVKANAYGHGAAECARALAGNGARWLGVTCVDEGVQLRRELPDVRILVMSGIWQGEAEAALEQDLTPVVWETRHLDWLEQAAARLRAAPGDCPVHVEIDTGMSRQGIRPDGLEPLLGRFGKASPLRLQAVMTHFHMPGNTEFKAGQVREFVTAIGTIHQHDLRPEILSAGSSAAALDPDAELARTAQRMGAQLMVRAGISLYGYAPDREYSTEAAAQLKPVLGWKTRVVSVREIPAGSTVGYDATFTAQRAMRIALLPVGYADGMNRLLSNRGCVLVRGQRAPVVGRISMDHTTVDVTDVVGAGVGDEVALIGEQGSEAVTAADLAKLGGTISYEVLCDISARVTRVMVD